MMNAMDSQLLEGNGEGERDNHLPAGVAAILDRLNRIAIDMDNLVNSSRLERLHIAEANPT